MDFLGVGPLELIFVLIIALLIIGPKDIGKTARTIGKFLNRLYKSDEWRALTEASRTIRTLPNRLAREAELEELNDIKDSFKGASKELKDTRDELLKETRAAIPDPPSTISPNEGSMKAWTSPSDDGEAQTENPNSQGSTPMEES
jgi:Sec-independent protein translocase protein TatA